MPKNLRQQSLSRWGLGDNPFITLPPQTDAERQQVFTGRQHELEMIMNLVKRPRGIFLVGLFGVGKSILVLESLRLLREQGRIVVYTKYSPQDGFKKTILKQVSTVCGTKFPNETYGILASPKNASSMGQANRRDIEIAAGQVSDAIGSIGSMLDLYQDMAKPMVIAVDYLEGADIGNIADIIQDTRQLIEVGCSVILLGHPFGSTAGLSSSADILYPLPLNTLPEADLVEMMGKYLDLTRVQFMSGSPATHPFTLDAAKIIARTISKLGLTPRIFNFACELLLEEAAAQGKEYIDEDFVTDNWQRIAENFLVRSLKDEDKRHYEVIYKAGGAFSEDTRDTIKEIGGALSEYLEVRDILAGLIQKNVLIEREKDGKREFIINPMVNQRAVRKLPTAKEANISTVTLFYSYSHKDEKLRDRLETSLALLKREGQISGWHDRKIGAGHEWAGEIDAHLEDANIILLLVSPDFIASDYCYDIEVSRAMERHELGDAIVVPIILRPCNWHSAPFGKLQALPKDAKAITTWKIRDQAFEDVVNGIKAIFEEL